MCSMDHEARLNRVLAGLFGIQSWHKLTDWHRRPAATAGDYPGAGRGRVNLHAAGALEGRQEPAHLPLVVGFHDQIQGVLAPDYRLAPNLHAELRDAWPTQVIEQACAPVWIASGTLLGRMQMPDDKQRHDRLRSRVEAESDKPGLREDVRTW